MALQWDRGLHPGWDERLQAELLSSLLLQWGRGLRLGWDLSSRSPRIGSSCFNGAEACASDGTMVLEAMQLRKLLQWGRGFRLGWDERERRRPSCPRCFNGAEACASDGTSSAPRTSATGTCFNGAEACASDGTRRRRVHLDGQGEASMGPRLAPRMGRLGACAGEAERLASMGPRLSPRMGQARLEPLLGEHEASMGPRLAPRMGRWPLRLPRLPCCFNGAEACASDGTQALGRDPQACALQWGRGLRLGWDRLDARGASGDTCFNGAEACASDGTPMSPESSPNSLYLQWGRGLRLGWDPVNMFLRPSVPASMGPRLAPRMGLPTQFNELETRVASMEPRLAPRMQADASRAVATLQLLRAPTRKRRQNGSGETVTIRSCNLRMPWRVQLVYAVRGRLVRVR